MPAKGEFSVQPVVETDDPVIALHEGRPGIPAHDAGRQERDRPGHGRRGAKTYFAAQRLLPILNVEGQPRLAEAVRAYLNIESRPGRLECLDWVAMVGRLTGRAIQHLDKGM